MPLRPPPPLALALAPSLRRSRALLVSTVLTAGLAATAVACATDNGEALNGEDLGPIPERPSASRDGGPSAAADDGGGGVGPSADASPLDDGAAPGAGTCAAGTVVVVAGSDATLSSSVQQRGGAWAGAGLGGAALSVPSLVATPSGFVAVTRNTGDALTASAWDGAWSAPSPLPGGATRGAPALAVDGANVHLAYHQPSHGLAYRAFTGGAWSGADEAIQPPGGAQSFGPSEPALASAGPEVVAAFDGDDGGLYVQSRSGGAWTAATPIDGAGVHKPAPPVLVSLEGASDLLVLFADNSGDHAIRHAVRTSGTRAWSKAANTADLAFTPEAFRAARISPSKVLVTYRGGNQRPYVMTGTVANGAVTWTSPVALLPDASTVDSTPAVARGVCGDDAVAVVAVAGAVKATRLRNGAWTTPEVVNGASGARVAVATR